MSRRSGVITKLVSCLFIGMPGAMVLIWGVLAAVVSFLPGAEVDIAGSNLPIVGFLAGLIATATGALSVWINYRIWRRSASRRQISPSPAASTRAENATP